MAKLLPRLTIILLLPLIVIVVVTVYYRQQVQQAVDSALALMPATVRLDYDSLSGDIDGLVTLQDVVFSQTDSATRLSVDRVLIHTSGWQYLLQAGDQLAQGVWPQQIRVELQGVEFQLNPANTQLADRLLVSVLPQTEAISLLAMACGGHKPLSFQQLHEMGVGRLQGGLAISYRYDSNTGAANADISFHPENMFVLALSMEGVMPATQLTSALFDAFPLKLKQLQVEYRDKGYHQRRNSYCAGLDDDIVSQYMKIHGSRVRENLTQQGWKVPLRVATDYRVMMAGDGGFQLDLRPVEPLAFDNQSWQEVQDLESQKLLRRLNLVLKINQRPIDLLAMLPTTRYQSPEVIALLQQTEEYAPGAGVTEGEQGNNSSQKLSPDKLRRQQTQALLRNAMKGAAQNTPSERSFKAVEVAEVGRHVGNRIRLETYFGRRVEGTLQRIEGKMLYVTQHLEQGSAVYPIDKTKLSELEVWH